MEEELNSRLPFIKDSLMTSEGARLFSMLLEKLHKKRVGNMMGAIYGVVERFGELEDLGYRPGSAPKQLCGLGNVS